MGNLLFSANEEYDNPSNESVINISDKCIDWLTNEEQEQDTDSPQTDDSKVEDDKWMKKLKCIDDIHSNENGLTFQALDELLTCVESQIEPIRPQVCSSDALILCLKKQKHCMIKCKRLIDEYIDCVDTYRVNIIKEKVEAERRLKKKEDENEIAKQFLKSE